MVYLALIILGLCFGSFVNALVWRVHEQDAVKSPKSKKGRAKLRELSIVHGRSMCPSCEHTLSAKDLIPVLSWIELRGKCRYCGVKFADTPITELALPLLFVLSYMFWPMDFNSLGVFVFLSWLVFLTGFLALAIYDIKWFLIPDRIVYTLLGLSVIQVIVAVVFFDGGGLSAILGAAYGFLIGGGVFYVLFQMSGGKWIGGGDVKLGAVLGVLLGGPLSALLMIFSASILGTLVSVPLLLTKKATAKTHLPFGPMLIAGAIVVKLFGAGVITWYKRQVGL